MGWNNTCAIVSTGLVFALGASAQMLTSASELQGRVVNQSGVGVANVVVELRALSGNIAATATTVSDGSFNLDSQLRLPAELDVIANGAVTAVTIGTGAALGTILIRVPSDPMEETSPVDTVSLNDLEAPAQAKSKLSAAQKAIAKLQLDKAWSLVNEAIHLAPNWGRAYTVRGVLSLQNQDYLGAEQDFSTAIARDPKDATSLTQLGKLYASIGKLNLADHYLRAALNLPPVAWPTYFEMANLDLKRGHYAEAELMAQAGLEDSPPAPPTLHFLTAKAAEGLHQNAHAIAEYRQFIAQTQNSPALASARHFASIRASALAPPASKR